MAAEGPLPSDLIATIGLHGSASTWVFNVIRELVAARIGFDRMVTFYADDLAQVPGASARAGRAIVFKSHHGSHQLDEWLQERNATIILSLHDPRDACVSMTQRFAAPLRHSIQWIAQDCERVARLAAHGYPQLRFEDRFFEKRRSVDLLSDCLRISCTPEVKGRDIRALPHRGGAKVRAQPEALPPERLTLVGQYRMDRVTQVLATHIGDARSGKWRDLPAQIQVELTRYFRPFLDRFGYEA